MIALLLASALAHGVDQDLVLIDVDGAKARVTLTPRASAFPDADDDGDGRLSVAEIRAHRADIDAMVDGSFQLLDQSGRVGEVSFGDLVVPHAFDDHHDSGAHLRVIRHLTFPEEVTAIEATVSLFAPEVDAQVVAVQIGRDEVRKFRVDAPSGRVQVGLEGPAVLQADTGAPGELGVAGLLFAMVCLLVAAAGGSAAYEQIRR